MTMNKISIIGNVGTEPEMRYTPNGVPVTSFRVATNRRWTSADGEKHEETEWFRVNAWNRLAEQSNQYVTKGMKVYVDGRLKSSPYISRDGEARAGNEISAFQVLFLDRAPPTADEAGAEAGAEAGDVEDLPW
jgi:single-strand DNA-binding protein